MAEASPLSLSVLLSVTAVLTGTETKSNQLPSVATVLKSRLVRAYEMLGAGLDIPEDSTDLNEIQYATAKLSLYLIEQVQALLDLVDFETPNPEQTTPLGTRDLSQIRTLLSIVFKWAVRRFLAELEHRPSLCTTSEEPQIIDLTESRFNVDEFPSLVLRLLYLVFPSGRPDKIRQTWITTSILSHHFVDTLIPCLFLGWSRKPFSETVSRASQEIKFLSVHFVNLLHPHEAITALGTVLSSTSNNHTHFAHIPKTCARLLSDQLKRPDGVRGLCLAVFGEDTEVVETAPLEKLEHIARVLGTVPSATKPEAYFEFIIPCVLELLLPASSEKTPLSHKRAAAFALSRMISANFRHNVISSAILLPLLHDPFMSSSRIEKNEISPLPLRTRSWHLSPTEALKTLQAFLLHTDPSPIEVSTLLTPIIPEIYTLLALHRCSKTVDPTVRESLDSLLNAWARIVGSADVIDCLCSIVNGAGGDWKLDIEEGFMRSSKQHAGPSISLLEAAELEHSLKHDIDIHANPFNLRPDPADFVRLLKSLDRKDVTSEVFVRLLNEYRELKETESDPIRTLLHLQIILQVQAQLSTTILSKPEHVISFIKHALSSEVQHPSSHAPKLAQKKGLGLQDLRIVEKEGSDAGDSDDEDEDGTPENFLDVAGRKDELVVTAITLLLSILEGNSDVSPRTNPDLNDILVSLDAFTSHTSPAVRQLSREARLVLTARTASTSSESSASALRPMTTTQPVQEIYQKALKLLQDPIIPVRAHGLQLLRDLVSGHASPERATGRRSTKRPAIDPALVPGILSIFLQSIQDDEPYLFLNAVQGLAAMVDGYGRDVLRGVMDVYLSGTGLGRSVASTSVTLMSKEELDARIRVGEVLNLVVKRCGSALSLYVDILVPPLLAILRNRHFPTTLRTSTLSILAQCMETHAFSMTVYTTGLADTCIELIQLESVAARNFTGTGDKRKATTSKKVGIEEDGQNDSVTRPIRIPEPTDVDPVTNDAKVPAFRRSAIHFLSQLLRAHTAIAHDSRRMSATIPAVTVNIEGSLLQGGTLRDTGIPGSILKRASLVLRYLAITDKDVVTRVMAREAVELVEQYREASMGF